ncbi:MAG: SDR family NAD(P)-dependent oxidoreductase [Myxococcota bacterium]
MAGLLDGKVVLVTGAGNGIGRAHALALAREGARVVVNDLGGARDGTGASSSAAEAVVAEIVAMGGDAVANADSVTDPAGCERMVKAALERWGRLDGVVNNAGILRDKSFVKLTEAEWDVVIAVHLKGTFNVCKAAVPALQAQGGAIVNTSSISGLVGNFGQSNYAAAKAGIYGLTRVLSMELRKSGVTANCVAPIAKTRMTDDIDRVSADATPEHVAPVVVYLCSDLAKDVTGRVFGVHGQHLHGYEMKLAEGVEKPGKEPWAPREIAEKLEDIFRLDAPAPKAAAAPAGDSPVRAVFALAPQAYRPERAGDWKARIHFAIKDGPGQTIHCEAGKCTVEDGLVGTPDCTVKTDTETIVGILKQTTDPQKAFMKGRIAADNLGVLMKFAMYFDFSPPKAAEPVAAEKTWPIGKVYDLGFQFAEPGHARAYAEATGDTSPAYEGPDAICPPMFHVRLFKELMFRVATDPDLGLDLLRLVHGEHDATFHRPIRPWDLVQIRGKLLSVEEKSSGLLVTSGLYGFVEGALAVECRTAYFIRGAKKGEGGGAKAPEEARPAPDFTAAIAVAPDQSLRYAAASLDDNPIHVDEATARSAGLPGVILQGLCTMAMTGVAFVREAAGGDARRLKRLSVRFARPVLNGVTLTASGWRTGEKIWQLETRDADGNVVISQAAVELR